MTKVKVQIYKTILDQFGTHGVEDELTEVEPAASNSRNEHIKQLRAKQE